MKIGLVGYQGSGKSTLFEWLTGEPANPAHAHTGQSAMAPIPDERIATLCEIYKPKKVTQAALEIVDTPGLSRDHQGNAARLGLIREAECLVMVIPAFSGADAARELNGFAEDLLLADLEIVTGRVERLRESTKKPRPNREQELADLAALEELQAKLEAGQFVPTDQMTEDQRRATRSFRLLTEKPRLVVVNVADDETDLDQYRRVVPEGTPVVVSQLGLEVELGKMSPEDRQEFEAEMQLLGPRKEEVIRQIMLASGQFTFFTAGEKEVRTWLLPIGGTALDAAAGIHTDLAKGFIRASVMRVEDLVRLGSEREVKAQGLMRQEHRDYVVQDGDILLIHHS